MPNQPLYRDPSGQLWVLAHAGWQIGRTKVGWIRPDGSTLTIQGQRLDGAAPSLEVDIPNQYYPGPIEPTYMIFPKTGCWQIEAHASDAVLRFVVSVPRLSVPGYD